MREKLDATCASDTDERADVSQAVLVVGKVVQGYDTNINVRLVPGRDVDVSLRPKVCQPRKGAPRRDAELLPLPPDLVDKFKKFDQAMVAWLAQNEGNARLYLENPVEALGKAGLELTRSEQKAILRTYREVREAAVVGPGVKVESLTAVAFPRGQIGKIKPGQRPSDGNDNIGCAKE